ncbi:MAG: hypothetical protein JWM90_1458 [Thermoleophilia bacterium]|nr:hypothetical protein [Thermoleophilia bacterium]
MQIPHEGGFDLRAAAAKINAFDWPALEALSGHVTKATATFADVSRQLGTHDTALTPALRASVLSGIAELTATQDIKLAHDRKLIASAITDAKAALDLIVPDARKDGWFSMHPFTVAGRALRDISQVVPSVLWSAYAPMQAVEVSIGDHAATYHSQGWSSE